jgi:peptide/nickel transport system permease protein/oligopeptide transport system permease protein
MLLAGFVLGVTGLTITAQLTRTSMSENLRADFVRTAHAKGVRRWRVIRLHALRNSLLPVVTNLGITLATLMGGAIVVESIFNVPGVGREIQRSLFRGETSVVIGAATLLVLIYLFVNLVVDLLYVVIDPRIRYE